MVDEQSDEQSHKQLILHHVKAISLAIDFALTNLVATIPPKKRAELTQIMLDHYWEWNSCDIFDNSISLLLEDSQMDEKQGNIRELFEKSVRPVSEGSRFNIHFEQNTIMQLVLNQEIHMEESDEEESQP
ncbi:MAG: hypothetical protein ABW146_08375 [Candidatus Sedimenticola sp. 6PFRAG7]